MRITWIYSRWSSNSGSRSCLSSNNFARTVIINCYGLIHPKFLELTWNRSLHKTYSLACLVSLQLVVLLSSLTWSFLEASSVVKHVGSGLFRKNRISGLISWRVWRSGSRVCSSRPFTCPSVLTWRTMASFATARARSLWRKGSSFVAGLSVATLSQNFIYS